MSDLISREALRREMYRKSFEVDDGRNVWNSGLWIRYKIFEEAIKDAPAVEAIPVEWIEEKLKEINATARRASHLGHHSEALVSYSHSIALNELLGEWKQRKEE